MEKLFHSLSIDNQLVLIDALNRIGSESELYAFVGKLILWNRAEINHALEIINGK